MSVRYVRIPPPENDNGDNFASMIDQRTASSSAGCLNDKYKKFPLRNLLYSSR